MALSGMHIRDRASGQGRMRRNHCAGLLMSEKRSGLRRDCDKAPWFRFPGGLGLFGGGRVQVAPDSNYCIILCADGSGQKAKDTRYSRVGQKLGEHDKDWLRASVLG